MFKLQWHLLYSYEQQHRSSGNCSVVSSDQDTTRNANYRCPHQSNSLVSVWKHIAMLLTFIFCYVSSLLVDTIVIEPNQTVCAYTRPKFGLGW